MTIPLLPARTSYADFFFNYQIARKPCMLSAALTETWNARKVWVKGDSLDEAAFVSLFHLESAVVPVVKCKDGDDYSADYDKMNIVSYFEDEDTRKYLKDWHFQADHPGHGAYDVPRIFSNDWLNEYFDFKNDPVQQDYRFVYIGKENTCTPRHADVFRSHSWSANICGSKKWLICGDSSDPVSEVEVVQNPGEVSFLPSLCEHAVENIPSGKFTVSVNHNWFNASNVNVVADYLFKSYKEVLAEIEDCRGSFSDKEFNDQAQLLLKTVAGMDLPEFAEFLQFILKRRLSSAKEVFRFVKDLLICDSCSENVWKCVFDSEVCRKVCFEKVSKRCECRDCTNELCDSCCCFFACFDFAVARDVLQRYYPECRELCSYVLIE